MVRSPLYYLFVCFLCTSEVNYSTTKWGLTLGSNPRHWKWDSYFRLGALPTELAWRILWHNNIVWAYLIFKNKSTDFDKNFKLILEISVKFREQFETRLKIYHVLYPIYHTRSFNLWRISSHKARYTDLIVNWGTYYTASKILNYTNLTTFYLFYYKEIQINIILPYLSTSLSWTYYS